MQCFNLLQDTIGAVKYIRSFFKFFKYVIWHHFNILFFLKLTLSCSILVQLSRKVIMVYGQPQKH